jgi:hypothetical protein
MSNNPTHYHEETPERVKALIERLIHSGERVRLFYGDQNTGRYWGDEYDVTGTIGRSGGTQPIPILLANSRSHGGGGILDHCIVRMLVNGVEVYRHPNYNSEFESATVRPSELPEYSHAVYTEEGGEVARFHSERAAVNYLAFMRGERMSK